MEQKRFDDLSRSLAERPARRRGVLAGGGGALLGLLGRNRVLAQDDDLGGSGDQTPDETTEPEDETQAAPASDDLCVMEFTATVRTGPTLEDGGNAVLTGLLSFRLGDDAELVPADSQLEADGGNRYPVTGQTRGHAVSLKINLGPGSIVALGTAEASARSCAGEMRGMTTGPRPGDLGDWIARAGQS